MHNLTCQRCSHEWEYSGESEHYCTCPNCKTSVKVPVSERAEAADSPEASSEAEPPPERGTTSEQVAVRAGQHEEREMSVAEAVVALDESVMELYDLLDAQSGSVSELSQEVEERGRSVDELERGLQELAGYFKEAIEEMGGEVEYDHVDAGRAVPAALEEMDVDGDVYDPSEEFDG